MAQCKRFFAIGMRNACHPNMKCGDDEQLDCEHGALRPFRHLNLR